MRLLACFTLALLTLQPVAAQEVKRATVLQGDPRLAKPVTVHSRKITLFDLLRDVSRQTGASLTPERTVVDEPLMLAVTQMPARDLLRHVADLTHFTWIRNGGTAEKPTYLLFKDVVAVREEQAELTRAQREVLAAIQDELRRCREFSQMPADRAQKELERADKQMEALFRGAFAGGEGVAGLNSPRNMRSMLDGMTLRSVTSPTGRVMLQLLDSLSPTHWESVMAEEPLVFSTRPGEGELPLPARFADALRQNAPGFPFSKSIFSGFGEQVEQGLTQVEGMMKQQWGRAEGFEVGIQLTMQAAAQPMGTLRVAPTPLMPAGGAGGPGEESLGPLFGMSGLNLMGMPKSLLDPDEDPVARDQRLGADPVLGRKARIKLPERKPDAPAPGNPGIAMLLGNSRRAAEVLPLVEQAFGLRIISDAYNRQAMATFPGSGEVELPLYKALDQLAGGRTWEVFGDTVRIKSKSWAHDRRSEIPVRYMKRWMEARARKGSFSLDDLAEIAGLLRDEQVESLMFAALEVDGADGGELMQVAMNKEMLRFWGKLLPLQRRNLLAGQAVPARSLFPPQQQALALLSRPKGNSMFAFMNGIKPARSLTSLAQALVSMETTSLQPRANDAPQKATGGPGMYTLRVAFPNGQKDEYRLTLFSGAAQAGPTTTTAPAAPEPPR
jgi:hypothetical protein